MRFTRFHQNRIDAATRDSLAQSFLAPEHFVQAIFIVPGSGILGPVPGLRGTAHVSVDRVVEAARPFLAAGVDKLLLFGLCDREQRDATGSASRAGDALVPAAIRLLKAELPQLCLLTDICLCAYTDHGHCGVLAAGEDGRNVIANDATLPFLAAMALAHAEAGADWVAPSAMMDGQVAAIRSALDAAAGTRILGYSAKFASAFYGPFRGAAQSAPAFGDRKGYQMDPRNGDEAQEEIAADLEEGADAVMVKPAGAYLDVLARARATWPRVLLAAYQTSGDIMTLHAAAQAGHLDYDWALSEQLHAIRRAGADWILGYGAADYLGISLPWGNEAHG